MDGLDERRDVEQKLRRLVDGNSPDFWLSDGTWCKFRMQYQAGLDAWFYLSIEKSLRALARKFENEPQLFPAAKNRFLKRRAGKLERTQPEFFSGAKDRLAQSIESINRITPGPLSLPQKLHQHQVKGLARIVSEAERSEKGLPFCMKPKEAHRIVGTFLAEPAGRKRSAVYEDAVSLYRSGVRSMHKICLQLDSAYSSKTPGEQALERSRFKSAINRRLGRSASEVGTKSPL